MDDQRFDDIVKQKVGEYEDKRFDPSALSSLHYQMAGMSAWPWYSRYSTELLIASGMALCTAMIIVSQWHFSRNQSNILQRNAAEITAQQMQIKGLVNEIKILKNMPLDTLRVSGFKTDPGLSSYSLLLIQRIEKLEDELLKMQNDLLAYRNDPDQSLTDDDDSSKRVSDKRENIYSSVNAGRLSVKSKQRMRAQPMLSKQKTTGDAELSVETLRAIEKHYQRGVGIRVGPTVEISNPAYDGGTSKIDYGGGVLGDFILSPTISIETGGKFWHRSYETSEGALLRKLPNVDNTLGPLLNAEVDSWMLEIPVSVKYRFPINIRTSWVGGLGYSSRMYTRQIFEYEYAVDGNPSARLSTSTSVNTMKFFPGTLNISLGLDHELKNRKNLETAIFYQYGFRGGVEKIKGNFFGIRSTYWFTLR